ncbi:uncharacterized protein LOC132631546 [Lycium barbarum]|uniref:uncharacterized protein LOC132631546 n=1 Tax=Lycium barbarum TaxID=112863 RepID=UPI00293EC860|nr:uncharacterized protein LOC132631546 [Lycium barbarum]
MSQFSHLKRKLGNTNWSKNSRSRRRRRKFQKPAGARKESDSLKDDNNNNNNIASVTYDEDEDDIDLQQILFYSAQFHSGKKLGPCSDKAAGKKVLEPQYSVIYGSISKVNSIHERGESSCTYCEICGDAKPPNTLIQGSSCRHYYCKECIRNYIAEKIDEDINEVKCPVKNCKRILDVESLMPKDFLVRVEDAIRETEVLASPCVIECPFLDCIGELVDDKKGFLIRACPECRRIFCAGGGDNV